MSLTAGSGRGLRSYTEPNRQFFSTWYPNRSGESYPEDCSGSGRVPVTQPGCSTLVFVAPSARDTPTCVCFRGTFIPPFVHIHSFDISYSLHLENDIFVAYVAQFVPHPFWLWLRRQLPVLSYQPSFVCVLHCFFFLFELLMYTLNTRTNYYADNDFIIDHRYRQDLVFEE